MPRFFVDRKNIFEDTIKITNTDVNHIKRVLRMDTGNSLTICDGMGNDYEAKISDIKETQIICNILSKKKSDTEPPIEVTLFQCLPKASKMDYIIQKATELGIFSIVPCSSMRCVVKLDDKKSQEKKCERWQKISSEAAKQCGRGIIPKICMPMTLNEVLLASKEYDLFFVPYECEEQTNIKSVLISAQNPKKVAFLIGPEGGFDISEIDQIKKANIQTVTLGKRILRTETAGEAVLSMIMYEIGDINA